MVLVPLFRYCLLSAAEAQMPVERGLEVITVAGRDLPALHGCRTRDVLAWSCRPGCEPIPCQVDEVDPNGRYVLDTGDGGAHDEAPGVLDLTDVVLVQVADLGSDANPLPLGARYRLRVADPLLQTEGVVFLGCSDGSVPLPPPSARVQVDVGADSVQMRRLKVRFSGPLPNFLAIDGGPNVLDRLKVRAQARFLFGLVTIRRNESDLEGQVLGWRVGPLRAIRAQQQWVHLGWGIRTPTLHSYAFFYPDYLDVPVALRLRFRATHFFSDIRIRGYADFRDLRGWTLVLPDDPMGYAVDGRMTAAEAALNTLDPLWFALSGPNLTLVQYFGLSRSLQSVKRRFLYRDDAESALPPEAVPGEVPGVGYELTDWRAVGSGVHSLHVMSFALPREASPQRLIAFQQRPMALKPELTR
ncbi:MAG: hypothetical protein KatS3mg077_2771 [Candidatus Binatia bacterium]|nr:MAG: hypothetical protein KatS3mg077_2771 [Candidatus Binatia bacterium]